VGKVGFLLKTLEFEPEMCQNVSTVCYVLFALAGV